MESALDLPTVLFHAAAGLVGDWPLSAQVSLAALAALLAAGQLEGTARNLARVVRLTWRVGRAGTRGAVAGVRWLRGSPHLPVGAEAAELLRLLADPDNWTFTPSEGYGEDVYKVAGVRSVLSPDLAILPQRQCVHVNGTCVDGRYNRRELRDIRAAAARMVEYERAVKARAADAKLLQALDCHRQAQPGNRTVAGALVGWSPADRTAL